MIVKVQVPLATNTEPVAMIYDKRRSFVTTVPVTKDIKKIMRGQFKLFFHAKLVKDKDDPRPNAVKVELGKEANWQDW